MADKLRAIERCAYCQAYVPVTHVTIPARSNETPIQATVATCDRCFEDGR